MAQFLYHEACPRCRELGRDKRGNNLGVYSDGSKYCFSCSYKEDSNTMNLDYLSQRQHQQQKQKEQKNGAIGLPGDFTISLPEVAREWLRQYGITEAEIESNHIGWSTEHERLIFPVFGVGNDLLMYQGRAFSHDREKPKWSTKGFPEKVFHILGDNGSPSLCVVEDILSCIKVARVMPCMPLWGSMLSTPRLIRLSDLCSKLVIWLDNDKQMYATKRSIAAKPFFEVVRVVVTDYDPKVYITPEIREALQ